MSGIQCTILSLLSISLHQLSQILSSSIFPVCFLEFYTFGCYSLKMFHMPNCQICQKFFWWCFSFIFLGPDVCTIFSLGRQQFPLVPPPPTHTHSIFLFSHLLPEWHVLCKYVIMSISHFKSFPKPLSKSLTPRDNPCPGFHLFHMLANKAHWASLRGRIVGALSFYSQHLACVTQT